MSDTFRSRLAAGSWTLGLCSALTLGACKDEPPIDAADAGEAPSTSRDAGSEPAKDAATEQSGVYAFVRSAADDGYFVTVTDEFGLKADASELASDKAREFRGDAVAVSGNLLEVEESTVHQWKIDDKLAVMKGASVSFSEFPLAEGANDFFQFQVDDHHRFLPFDIVSRVVWDPIEMKIVKVVEGDSKIPLEAEGLKARPAGNRSRIEYQGNIKMPVFYLDEEYVFFAKNTALGVYDRKTFEEIEVIDLPCPGLAIATQDEEGYTYFGTWDYSPLPALYHKGPQPCAARLTPDDKLDEEWTTDFTDLTDGRYGINFYYVRDGWGLMDVLDHETVDLDFDAAEIPEEALSEVWDRQHWRIWRIDLKNKSARPLDELGDDVHLGFWSLLRIDGRLFLNLAAEETTKLYELDKDGKPTLYDEAPNALVSWLKVR